jgi:hypothetical protein
MKNARGPRLRAFFVAAALPDHPSGADKSRPLEPLQDRAPNTDFNRVCKAKNGLIFFIPQTPETLGESLCQGRIAADSVVNGVDSFERGDNLRL